MAALYDCGISDIIIEINGSEMPILDGSIEPFIFLIRSAGTKDLDIESKLLVIKEDISITANGVTASVSVADHLLIGCRTEHGSKDDYNLYLIKISI